MDDAISAVRGFNRFYTQFVGALDARFLGTHITLAEARLLFEIAHHEAPLASDLQAALDMDAGYVSRVLRRFTEQGWIARRRGPDDARRRPISLTPAGRAAFEIVDQRQRAEVAKALDRLAPYQRSRLVGALKTSQTLLSAPPPPAFTIRTFGPGDMGRIAWRQSRLYREVYGWGPGIEVIVGEGATSFLRDFKPGREQCWVAEVDGEMAGSIFLMDGGDGVTGRLRLLYVEPWARGLGIGGTLVDTCVGFAREAGYRAIQLWTHTILESARRIYAAQGFRCVDTYMQDQFGEPVQSETWRLELAAGNVSADAASLK